MTARLIQQYHCITRVEAGAKARALGPGNGLHSLAPHSTALNYLTQFGTKKSRFSDVAAYRNKITGKKVEAVQLTIGTFAAPRPNLDRIIGVVYNRREGAAFIKNGAERANIGDWIVQDQYGNPSVVSADAFLCEYEPMSADVIPLRR